MNRSRFAYQLVVGQALALVLVLGGVVPSLRAASSPLTWRGLFPPASAYPNGTHLLPLYTSTHATDVLDPGAARQVQRFRFLIGGVQDADLPAQAVTSVTVLVFRDAHVAATFLHAYHPSELQNPALPGNAVSRFGTGARFIVGACANCGPSTPLLGVLLLQRDASTVEIVTQPPNHSLAMRLAAAGTLVGAAQAGMGHWHLLLDGALVNMYCGTGAALSMQNVAPGKHTIEVMLAANNHMTMMGKGQMASVSFTYQPASPLPALAPYTASGRPTVSIISPANGATVGESFPVELDWTNFTPSCDLLGKKNLAGYGHWHLNIDSMSGPMMGMGTLLAMGCSHSTTVFTDGLKPGTHTLYALLVDNQHAPLMPAVATSITIKVK